MRKIENRDNITLFHFVAVLIIIVIIGVIRNFDYAGASSQVSVGILLVGGRDDNGWNESHYTGLRTACQELSCTLRVVENVPEERGPVEKAVKKLTGEGCNVIVLSSDGYGDYVDELAGAYPDRAFFCISGGNRAKNITSYFARLYQVRYLAGIVAGASSSSGILGYVAGMPNAQSIRGINAYAMGVRKSNPDARLLVYYTGSWNNEAREREAVRLLAAEGADVITYHMDTPAVISEAEEMGLYSVGCNSVDYEHSERFLTAAMYDWSVVYRIVLDDHMSGRTTAENGYWLGVEDGAVTLYPFSELVSEDTRALVAAEEARIRTNRDVFSGVIMDNTGKQRCAEGERISDSELFLNMDWYVEGVELYE